jgi:RNA polymerase sigma factor (sigma-70 family)
MRAASEGGVAQRGKDAEDKELVHRAMVDREAVAVLYGRYRDRLFAFCRCLTPNREAAEDLMETAFCRLIEHWSEIIRADTPILPWLFCVATNAFRSQNYRLGVERRHTQRTSSQMSVPVARDDADCIPKDAVRAAIKRRSSFERLCLTLSCVDGLPPRRIAAILGSTPRQVSNALVHARRCLRDELAPVVIADEEPRGADETGG